MREFAPAKVNLYLHVTGRRADGYHLLDSLAVFPDVGDWVGLDAGSGLTLAGPFAGSLPEGDDNLVLRAAALLGPDRPANLTLEKHLPVASGIGGGSADAAATLRLLARAWNLPPDTLSPLAARLGADVPVCLAARPSRMSGIGEILSPAPVLPECGLVLANPGIGVATADVFRARSGPFTPPADLPTAWDGAAAMAATLRLLSNDLQAPAIALCPAIADVLAALYAHPDCLLARMSGSGATCFGLFADPARAAAAAAALSRPGWWLWGGRLFTGDPSADQAPPPAHRPES